MKTLSLLAFCLAVCAPVWAQGGPAARISALLESAPTMNGASIPSLSSISAPPSATASSFKSINRTYDDSIVPPGLWATLPAPDAATLSWLASRIPGLKTGMVRVVPLDQADQLFAKAVARGMTPLDFFTDPGFSRAGAFYIPQETITTLFARYDVRCLTPATGTTTDGREFVMKAIVIGGGRIDSLYNLDSFVYNNDAFPDYSYKLASHVAEVIQAPGYMAINGIWANVSGFDVRIKRFVKVSATQIRVETAFKNIIKTMSPITRR